MILDWVLPDHSQTTQSPIIARSLQAKKWEARADRLANCVSFLEHKAVITSCVLWRGDAKVPALAGGLYWVEHNKAE